MPQLRFRNFSSLAFLQSVDKQRFLAPLLAGHAEYFARHGINVAALGDDDDSDLRLMQVFTQPDEEMPAELLEVLYMLDDMADEAGHDDILDEAERIGADLSGLDDDLPPGDFAIAVFFRHPRILRVCHERTACQKVKKFHEHQSRDDRRFSLAAAKAKVAELEQTLSPWFDARKRSPVCEIYVYRDEDEIRFQVTHGRPFRTEGSLTKRHQRSRVAYRPQKHDMVIYDTQTGILKINAQTAAERAAYCRAFGQAMFGDPDYFPEGQPYSLEALRTSGGTLAMVEGMENICLSELWIARDDDQRMMQILKARDLLGIIADGGTVDIHSGSLVRACFNIKYSQGGRARKLEVRPPNVAEYDRDRDGSVAEAFLQANGFMVTQAGNAGSGPVLGSA